MRNSIRGRLILIFIGLAIGPLLVVGTILAWRSFTSLQEQSLLLQQEAAKRVNTQVSAFFQELENEMRFTIQTQHLERSDQDHADALADLLAYQPAFSELHLLNSQGQEEVGVYRLSLGNAAPIDRSHSDQFRFPKDTGQMYYGPPFYDQTTNEPLMIISLPVVNLRSGSVEGVLVAVTRIKKVWDIIAGIEVGPGQSIYIVDADSEKVIAHRNPSVVLRETNFHLPEQNGIHSGLDGTRVVLALDKMSLGQQQHITIVAEQALTEALAPAINIVYVTLILIVVVAGLAGTLGLWNVRQIIQPIQALVKTAEQVSAGNLSEQAQVVSKDEIGTLASAFNAMTSQLKEMIAGLERRVAERTKALELSSEVSRRLSTILDRKELVSEVVNQVRDAFGYYHVQIYFYDEARQNLVMAGGTGEAGRTMVEQSHQLAKGRGLVGRAAENNAPILVADTTQNSQWLPNPLLPDTKSEATIPISVGELVLGVLDVQHNIPDGLKNEDIDALQSIAYQVAVAYQNTKSYTEIQHSQAQLSEALDIAKLANWEYDVARDRFMFNDHFYSIFRTTAEREGGYELSSAEYAERLVHPADLPVVGAEIEKALTSKDKHYSAQLEHRILYRDGSGTGYISVEVHIDRDDQGHILRYYGANQDITERKVLQEQLARRAYQQEAINLITQKIQSTTTVEDALQIAIRELGHALGQKPTLVSLNTAILAGKNKAFIHE